MNPLAFLNLVCRAGGTLLTALSICIPTIAAGAGAGATSADFEFFENRIRPIFVEHCYECHSAKSAKIKGGLYLDTREKLLAGGESGPVVVPGNPDASLLIKAVRYTDPDLRMPPKDKRLSAEQISDLETWIAMGAPDPRDEINPASAHQSSSEDHWAFQPVALPALPDVGHKDWVRSPVDAFILEKLDAKGLSPSERADKRTLIRRVAFDLTGLPPSPEEAAAFVADESENAFATMVEHYLASPRYGERWGRYWLDVARYADTKGYVFEEERRFPYSYTYRDYVVRAFNDDLPFDQFILEQIAADRLPLGEDQNPLAALGYLTLGRRFLNNQSDIIDDRIDVVTRGLMGLTVGCARCHDHKYDPIPSEDYYSLYGVFANSTEPDEKPLLGGSLPFQHSEYLAERTKRGDELETFQETSERKALTELRNRSGDYLLTAYDSFQLADDSKAEALARERKLHPQTVQRWMSRLEQWKKESNHPIFGPWFEFSKLATNGFTGGAHELLVRFAADGGEDSRLNPMVALALAGDPLKSMQDVCERYGKLLADVNSLWITRMEAQKAPDSDGHASSEIPQGFANASIEELRQILYGSDSPANVPEDELRRLFDVPTAQKLRALKRKLDELDATHPGAPPRAMALIDKENISGQKVFLRGNPRTQGQEVPPRFLRVLSGKDRKSFEKGSGRLELAQAIASPDNPLTARVFVNRVWLHLFGAGLVGTPSDFGVRCESPTHAELLDYLAWSFMNDGWSVKGLHRLILLSNVYQQSSKNRPECAKVDSNNELLWRMNRRRLDFEAFRDSIVAVAGQIDLEQGGRPVDLTEAPFTTRRAVYGFIERQNLPNLFRTFDFASPDTTSSRRFTTTVPQQALFMINSPFAIQQARRLAQRLELEAPVGNDQRIRRLYQLAFQRDPDSEEIEIALRFLESEHARLPKAEIHEPATENGLQLRPLEKLCQVILMANELAFFD
ncbi:MAG: PSD1 and planctomycete cytochrome C domain-containing protein [Verrucomicrobia bacterium]|nr:PSD1 and planctomycete cytochrome C domain-containing protein [Verrucomicrobiota bacterium]